MRNFLSLLLLLSALCLPGVVHAQNPQMVEIGGGTGFDCTLPFCNFFNHGMSQLLYKASEIEGSGTISAISFHSHSTETVPASSLKIYFATTAASTLSEPLPAASFTECYSATNDTLGDGDNWQTFTLDTPFAYDGTSNIVVCVCRQSAGYNGSVKWYYTTQTNRAIYRQNDENEAYGSINGSAGVLTYNDLPNIRFHFSNFVPTACPTPSNLTVSSSAGTSVTLGWSSNATNFVVAYGTGTDPEQMDTVHAASNSVTLTGLLAGAEYHVLVKAVCGVDVESLWSDVLHHTTFNTPCAPVVLDSSTHYLQDFESGMRCWTSVLMNHDALGSDYCIQLSEAHTGNGAFRTSAFHNSDDYRQFLILPEIDCATEVGMTFWYRRPSDYIDEYLAVGYSTTDNDTGSFGGWVLMSDISTAYQSDTLTFPAGTKFIAFRYGEYDGRSHAYVTIDDIELYQAYDTFSVAYPNSDFRLYYHIVDRQNHLVELAAPHRDSWNGYTAPSGGVHLSSTVTHEAVEYSVVGIAEKAFRGCSALTSFTPPISATYIGDSAFADCSALAYVGMWHATPPTLGTGAFVNCAPSLTIEVLCAAYGGFAAADDWAPYGENMSIVGVAIDRTASVTGNGTVAVSDIYEVENVKRVHVTATPDDGYMLQSVSASLYDCTGTTPLGDIVLFEDATGYWFNMAAVGMAKVSAVFVPEVLPSTIADEAQLLALANGINNGSIANGGAGSVYSLLADIAIAGTVPSIGTDAHPFRGTFRGYGHSLKLNGNALFGVTDGATIENVHTTTTSAVVASAQDSVGAIVNCARNATTIRFCSNNGSVGGHDFVGGICGRLSNNSNLHDCLNTGTVSAADNDAYVGGICGEAYYSFVTYCLAHGTVSSNNGAGLVGRVWSSTVQYCYMDKQMVGGPYIFREYNETSHISYVGSRPTNDLTGDILANRLGLSGNWSFVDGRYPELLVVANSTLADIAASPLNLYNDEGGYDRIDHVTQNFTPCSAFGTWSSSSALINFANGVAGVGDGTDQWVTLTLTSSDNSCSRSVALYVMPGEAPTGDPLGIDNPWDEAEPSLRSVELTLMPNPASRSTTLRVAADDASLAGARLVLYNLQGQRVLTIPHAQREQSIALDKLPGGVYLLRLEGARVSGVQKLVKK